MPDRRNLPGVTALKRTLASSPKAYLRVHALSRLVTYMIDQTD
jgi:hypothetical protein